MVMPAGLPALNPEFELAKAQLQNARKAYASLVEEYTCLISVVGKNLENEYMLKLGKKEYELFSCQVEILRLKREISLFQAARNRGESVSPEKVQQIIENEFAEYQAQLEAQQKKLQSAENYFSGRRFTEAESDELKKLYREIVRKLHPDLNPDLPPVAQDLWERVQRAYHSNDWEELYLLADMVDEFLEGKVDYVENISLLEQLREELEKITKKSEALKKQIQLTRERVPFTYEKILSVPAAVVKKRRELDQQIEVCKERIVELQQFKARF